MVDSVKVKWHRRTRDYRTMPCPFCGSPAEITHYSFGGVAIGCSFCDCYVGTHETQDDAVECWNTRQPST